MRMRQILLAVVLFLLAGTAFAAPPPPPSPDTPPAAPHMSLSHPNVFMVPQVSSPPIQFQNQGTPLGVSFIFNCSTGMSCSFVNGVMTVTSTGGSGTINSCATTNAIADYSAATTIDCGNGDFTYSTHTLTGGASALLNLSAMGGAGVTLPSGAGLHPTNNGNIIYNTSDGPEIKTANSTFILAGMSSIITANTIPKSNNSAFGFLAASSITDNGTTVTTTEPVNVASYQTATFCKANGTAASPSVAACGSSAAGMFSCATNASGATCQVNTTAVTANSSISITQNAADGGASQLNVTCNTASDLPSAAPILASKSAGTSFTINVGTITTNPACFEYLIVN